MMSLKERALAYHKNGRKGKIEVVSSKPCATQEELSLAYTPGVAEPCLEIAENPLESYNYTARGNLVAVISNGTAVLGLGNIGATASKPVMEGKGVLFKTFADIDVFDIEIDEKDPDKFIEIVKSLEPTFGGINLEDIKAPECFHIETELKRLMNIPVFHDDQHGTAIISAAGLLNALEIVGKKIDQIKLVFSGAGAAGLSCAKMAVNLGVPKDNIFMLDINGLITTDRAHKEPHSGFFAKNEKPQGLKDVIRDADVFMGLSAKNILTPDMLLSMSKNPIVFALANPDPEITYPLATQTRKDVIMATGRSDYPNQLNNVLGFPFIFRGTLDVRSKVISEEMKMAASIALAKLAKEPVPAEIKKIYNKPDLEFGRDYILPKPLDPRVLFWEAPAVAKAAMDGGHALMPIRDMDAYVKQLEVMAYKRFEKKF